MWDSDQVRKWSSGEWEKWEKWSSEEANGKWNDLPNKIADQILLFVIESFIPGFSNCNTYQIIIQTCKQFKLIQKKNKHILEQIYLQPTGSIPLLVLSWKITISTQKRNYCVSSIC